MRKKGPDTNGMFKLTLYIKTTKLNYYLVQISRELNYLSLFCLKTLDTFVNCQRPVFSLGVSQHTHDIPNLWKCGLDWSSNLQENNERKTPLLHYFGHVLSDAWKRLQLKSFYYFSEKLLLSQRLRYFRVSRFSQCAILSTALPLLVSSAFNFIEYV